MSFLKSMDISASALTAQRVRMDVIAENLANINTTRTAEGEPYRRRYVVMQQREDQTFAGMLERAKATSNGNGVRVTEIREDESPFKLDYDPDHPDANEEGYVQMPNVDLVVEMVDMMAATRSYEANITATNAIKSMALKALEI
ncbi:MAG: flagellar basal body rod protein FlgC [Candidatus Pelethousia sp.]|nr:flagellar basal body rod protein FlgC [Candidatus Pelethousia sp.]